MRSVITIGRQYGSHGRAIGKKIAEKFNIPYYDKELLTLAAKESGICEELILEHDEKPNPSLLFSVVSNLRSANELSTLQVDLPLNHKIFLAQFEAIKKVAEQGSCVIVGRCADYVLRNHSNAFHLFLYANLETRIQNVKTYLNVDEKEAKAIISKCDKERSSFYNYFSGQKWGDLENYHLCLNTSRLSEEQAVQMVCNTLETLEL